MVKNCKQTEITSARLRLKLLALLVAGACWTGFLAHQVSAQETAGPWGEPVNLSLSAGTSDPALVVDSSGRAHAVWKDATLNYFVHSSRVNGAWRAAVAVELPFGTRRSYPDLTEDQRTPLHTPLLWAGRNNQIHAIWLDLNGRLQYSNVSSTAFEDIEAWAAPQLLAQSARGAVAITDGLGRLHVAYARQSTFEQSPSGLYYRGSTDGGETWSEPVMLYNSPYFRSLSADQVNIQLTATDSGALIAAWDNPFLERVYVAKSSNGGESWGSPIEIDSRGQDDGAAATGPSSIRIASAGDQIHVVWQAGHGGTECAVYHRLSLDGGETWQSRGRVISRDESCASSSHLVAGKGNTILLVSMADDQAYLTAWDGSQWGDTVTRDELARFINPLNFRDVRLGCIQIAEGASDTAGNRK